MQISASVLSKVKNNISKVIIGKEDTIDFLLTALVSNGHVLLEDVPGTGKTLLARSLAKSMNMAFSRIQFTPDLLPSDVTGLSFFNQEDGKFLFKDGPVFTNILLADEINRATPRTQSSLLECMAEKQVTIDGITRPVGNPFFVIATQNPVETLGCFPLPEAQLDRFLLKISMGSLTLDEEIAMINRYILDEPLQTIEPICTVSDILQLQNACKQVFVHDDLKTYIANIIHATRNPHMYPYTSDFSVGVSPRGTLALLRASQGYALVQGRSFVVPEDIKSIAPAVLVHRISGVDLGTNEKRDLITRILADTPLPTEDWSKP